MHLLTRNNHAALHESQPRTAQFKSVNLTIRCKPRLWIEVKDDNRVPTPKKTSFIITNITDRGDNLYY